MNEKINRLAKGIIDSRMPEAELSPASFSSTVDFAGANRFELSIRSLSAAGLRGLVYSDNPRVRIENAVFTGGRNRIFLRVDPSFLRSGTVIFGRVCLITNAGEFSVPYRFTAVGTSVYEEKKETGEAAILAADHDPQYLRPEGKRPFNELERLITSRFPEDEELFAELCAMLIREQCTERWAFLIYQEAVRRDVRLTRLYEYYIYSFPDDFEGPIPREVLLYFSLDNSHDRRMKSVLYQNILRYQDPDTELYRQYEPEMRDYALSSVFEQRIDGKLAVIYAHMIYPDMIDERTAQILPGLLKAYHVQCRDTRMRRVVVRYPELAEGEGYLLSDGEAYVPLYFQNAKLFFEDNYGRLFEGVDYTARPVCDCPALLSACFRRNPAHPMVMLSAAERIVGKGVHSEEEKAVLLDVLEKLPLSRAFSEKVAEALVDSGLGIDFLDKIDVDYLPGSCKDKIFRALTEGGETKKAFLLAQKYGLLIAQPEPLAKLCCSMITGGLVPQEGDAEHFFLAACRIAFDSGCRAKELLSYLAKVYEGATEDMFAIFLAAEDAGADTKSLLERILIAKLFAGTRRHLDEACAAYSRKEPRDVLMRTYLTQRAADYFVDEIHVPAPFFRMLSDFLKNTKDQSRLPSIYLLAFTKHEAETGISDRTLAAEACTALAADGLVFSYTPGLLRTLGIRSDICGNNYIEFHGSRDQKPRLLVKIEPEDRDFHEEEMKRVYQGIYVKEVQLFSDDRLTYRVCEPGEQGTVLAEGRLQKQPAENIKISGEIVFPAGTKNETTSRIEKSETRYGQLDRMTAELAGGEEAALWAHLKEYVISDEMTRSLFDVL